MLLEKNLHNYHIFAGNIVSPATLEKFNLGIHSNLVNVLKSGTRMFEVTNFLQSQEIIQNYSQEDLSIFNEFLIVPLNTSNWLIGFITIHKHTSGFDDVEQDALVGLAALAAPHLANILFSEYPESLGRKHFEPLEKRVERELQMAADNNASVSIVVFSHKNRKRMENLVHPKGIERFDNGMRRILPKDLSPEDFYEEISPETFLFILRGNNRKITELFFRQKREEILKIPIRESLISPRLSFRIASYPEDGDILQEYVQFASQRVAE